jgi:hypothetical protein
MSDDHEDHLAVVRLPDASSAPGYRDALARLCHFRVNDFGDGLVGLAPAEGPGTTASHFKLIKICDGSSDLSDPAIWSPVREHPPRKRSDIDDPDAHLERLIARAQEIVERNPSTESQIVAFALQALGAAEVGDLPGLLSVNVSPLFETFPGGSLWMVTVDDVLLARLAFGRTQLAAHLTPDMPVGPERELLRAFSELTLTEGVHFGALMDLPLVALSPNVLGLQIPALPHVLVFCFGDALDLRRPYPTSFASLYRPTVLNDPEALDRSALIATNDEDDGPNLLAWWIERLNVIYSHATDPTRFADSEGYYDAPAQTAWTITVERMIGDALSLLAEPQATELDRVQLGFDTLDKAEALLGYGKLESGNGFQALMRRTQTVRRVREAFSRLPGDLGLRLAGEADRLFDDLRLEVRANTQAHRLTPKGARVARGEADKLVSISDDDLVATLCRAVRNSSHGLLDVLREHPDRYLLAVNTGGIPAELPALTPLLALALLADIESLIDGTWRSKLVGAPST